MQTIDDIEDTLMEAIAALKWAIFREVREEKSFLTRNEIREETNRRLDETVRLKLNWFKFPREN